MRRAVTVVGLGNMGGAAAARLAEVGHTVRGFDPDPTARRRAQDTGVLTFDTLAEAVRGSSIVITSLPNGAVVRSAWLDEGGVVASAAAGAVVVELSTIDPETMRTLGARAQARGLQVIDCPVSGGPAEARAGTLSLIVGGDDAAIDEVEDLLTDLGSIQRTGDVGTAKVVKIVNNMMSMGNVLVAAEAFAVGIAAGVEPQRLYDILSVSGGRSHHFTERFPKALAGDYNPGFTIELGEKDLALAVELARSMRTPAPSVSTTRDMYALARAEGYGEQDIVALLEMYRRWAEGTRT